MAEQLTKEERISQLNKRVKAEYGHKAGLLAYALECVDYFAGVREEIPSGWSGLGWVLRPGRPHWRDGREWDRIDKWNRELLNIGRGEHDFNDDSSDAVCAKCGEKRWSHTGWRYGGLVLLCRGYREDR